MWISFVSPVTTIFERLGQCFEYSFCLTNRKAKNHACPDTLMAFLNPDAPAMSFYDSLCNCQTHSRAFGLKAIARVAVARGTKELIEYSLTHFFGNGLSLVLHGDLDRFVIGPLGSDEDGCILPGSTSPRYRRG